METIKTSSKLKQAEQMLENQLDVPSFANNGYLYPNVEIVQTPCLLEKILFLYYISLYYLFKVSIFFITSSIIRLKSKGDISLSSIYFFISSIVL